VFVETYEKHCWRIRAYPQGHIISDYTVTDKKSTVSIYDTDVEERGCSIDVQHGELVPMHHIHACLHQQQNNSAWGLYASRGSVRGIPICSFTDMVEEKAVEEAIRIIDGMLLHVPEEIVKAMVDFGLEVAIIGRGQKTTDIPAHAHLKGKYIQNSNRSFEDGTRGLGATISCPILSCGEDNLLMLAGEDSYPYESILVHEFAHAVMNLGIWNSPLYYDIKQSYYAAQRNRLYDMKSYVMASPEEYWAEMTQAWFHATVRNDVTSGITTRQALMYHDPRLASIMLHVWGGDTDQEALWVCRTCTKRSDKRSAPSSSVCCLLM
jgi:hypothetical protein